MKVFSLSASKIKSLKLCEFKFYLEYHLFLSTGTSFAAEQGNMVHVIFERMGQDVRDGVALKNSYIFNNWREEVMHAYREEGLWTLSPKVKTNEKPCKGCEFNMDGLCDIAGKPIDEFEGCPKPEYQDALWLVERVMNDKEVMWPLDQKIIDVENRFKLKIPDGNEEITVNGIIDVVTELDNDTIDVVDYKSGNYIQSYNQCVKDPQLLIYHLAIRNKWRDYKNIMISIYYLRRKPLTLSFGKKEEVGTENALRHYFHMIQNNESPKRRCDKGWGEPRFDYVCKKMCDIELCKKEFSKFQDNGHKILPPPENPERHRRDWLKRLTEGSQKDQAFKEISNGGTRTTSPKTKTSGDTEDITKKK